MKPYTVFPDICVLYNVIPSLQVFKQPDTVSPGAYTTSIVSPGNIQPDTVSPGIYTTRYRFSRYMYNQIQYLQVNMQTDPVSPGIYTTSNLLSKYIYNQIPSLQVLCNQIPSLQVFIQPDTVSPDKYKIRYCLSR